MKKINNVIGLIFIAILIVVLYLAFLCSIVYCLSFIPFLDIEVVSWPPVLIFSIYVMIWSVPFEIISFLMDIRIKNKTLKKVIRPTTILLNFIAFTFFVVWLNSNVDGIRFSNSGLVLYIFIVLLLVIVINTGGNRIKDSENKKIV